MEIFRQQQTRTSKYQTSIIQRWKYCITPSNSINSSNINIIEGKRLYLCNLKYKILLYTIICVYIYNYVAEYQNFVINSNRISNVRLQRVCRHFTYACKLNIPTYKSHLGNKIYWSQQQIERVVCMQVQLWVLRMSS